MQRFISDYSIFYIPERTCKITIWAHLAWEYLLLMFLIVKLRSRILIAPGTAAYLDNLSDTPLVGNLTRHRLDH